jgi:hypothetical protein
MHAQDTQQSDEPETETQSSKSVILEPLVLPEETMTESDRNHENIVVSACAGNETFGQLVSMADADTETIKKHEKRASIVRVILARGGILTIVPAKIPVAFLVFGLHAKFGWVSRKPRMQCFWPKLPKNDQEAKLLQQIHQRCMKTDVPSHSAFGTKERPILKGSERHWARLQTPSPATCSSAHVDWLDDCRADAFSVGTLRK